MRPDAWYLKKLFYESNYVQMGKTWLHFEFCLNSWLGKIQNEAKFKGILKESKHHPSGKKKNKRGPKYTERNILGD